MKKTALLAAVTAMFAATPAMAGGSVGLSYGNTDSGGSDFDNWQVDGSFGHSAGSWGFQLDGSLGQLDGDSDVYGYGGHLYWQSGSARLGGVVTGSNVDGGGGLEIDEFVYGVEGSYELSPNVVIGGSGTLGTVDLFGIDVDSWNVDANVAFYGTPNFRIGGTAGIGNLDGTTDTDTSTLGLDAEYQFSSIPISLTAGYLHFETDGSSLDTDTLTIGARWNFGGGSLRDRDNATPFNVRTPLYGRVLDIR